MQLLSDSKNLQHQVAVFIWDSKVVQWWVTPDCFAVDALVSDIHDVGLDLNAAKCWFPWGSFAATWHMADLCATSAPNCGSCSRIYGSAFWAKASPRTTGCALETFTLFIQHLGISWVESSPHTPFFVQETMLPSLQHWFTPAVSARLQQLCKGYLCAPETHSRPNVGRRTQMLWPMLHMPHRSYGFSSKPTKISCIKPGAKPEEVVKRIGNGTSLR